MSTLEQDLAREEVGHLDLTAWVPAVVGTPTEEVVRKMRSAGVGCALITRGRRLAGIFTERDVLCKVVDRPDTWAAPIEQVMTRDPDTVGRLDRVGVALKVMNRKRYRNVPVLDDEGRPIGALTHDAVLRFIGDRLQQEVYNLPPDPNQVPDSPDGA